MSESGSAPDTGRSSRRASRHQDALRLLFLLQAAGDPVVAGHADAVAVLRGQKRLQALDFWMRNPDYLADELLNDYVGGRRPAGLTEAVAILESGEPDLRRYPMIRWLYGAFEPLDDALSLLRVAGLITWQPHSRSIGRGVVFHDYYLMHDGAEALKKIVEVAPDLDWYRQRAGLVASLAGRAGGNALKRRQYANETYKQTAQGKCIEPITDRVLRRVAELAS